MNGLNAGDWAKLKDAFLEYCVERSEFFMPEDFREQAPPISVDEVHLEEAVREIVRFDKNLLITLNGNGREFFMVCATPNTRVFLDSGGFVKYFEEEEAEWQTLLTRIEEPARPSSRVAGESHSKYVKKDKYYYAFVVMATLAFLYCLVDLLIHW